MILNLLKHMTKVFENAVSFMPTVMQPPGGSLYDYLNWFSLWYYIY